MEEDDFLPLSGLQHFVFCPRQCALIHVEGVWSENVLTSSGRVFHEKVHSGADQNRPGVLIARSVPLRSERLRLVGVADVVEFRNVEGVRRPYPVEYKRGRKGRRSADMVQVCAQGVCLEEMLGVDVPEGALFYGASRRRRPVELTAALRDKVVTVARGFHRMVAEAETPAAVPDGRCRNCSLRDACMPEATSRPAGAARYISAALRRARSEA